MVFNSFTELVENARRMESKARIAVVAAHEAHTLEAVLHAAEEGIVEPILIGESAKTAKIIQSMGKTPDGYKLIEASDIEACLAEAVKLVQNGQAEVIMKGKLETGQLMKTVLKKENNLRKDGLISLMALYSMPQYHKLFAVTDVALNIAPTLEEKKAILTNAVDTLHSLGIENPKVAVLCAVETVNSKMKETLDAAELKRMNQQGEISGCIVEGPISLDLATDAEAARIKGFESPVAGDADLFLVPDLVCGNVFVKTLTGFAGANTAGIMIGAKIPIVLLSRSAAAMDKYYSIAYAACVAAGNRGRAKQDG